jgi:hypothetical protein
MITISDLQTSILDLLHEIRDSEIEFIIGGGYGIYLKTRYVLNLNIRTLLKEWPEPRSTNDLDLFLRPELLIEPAKLKPLASVLASLGYKPIKGAEKYQFLKPGPEGDEIGGIKIDILTGPQQCFQGTGVKIDNRRAKPKPSVGIHAHPVNEALTLEEGLLSISIDGQLCSGKAWKGNVFLPHPFTFLMMKLFAFTDRMNDLDKEYGRYHALDLYTILATTMEEEWRLAIELSKKHKDQIYMIQAGNIVAEYFSADNRIGIIRLKESKYYRPTLQLNEFMSSLQELFPVEPY